jgi:hypothetical protein
MDRRAHPNAIQCCLTNLFLFWFDECTEHKKDNNNPDNFYPEERKSNTHNNLTVLLRVEVQDVCEEEKFFLVGN